MRHHRRLTTAVLTAVSGLAVAGLLAGPANASTVAPTHDAPAATPVAASPTASPSPSTASPLSVSGKISAVDVKAGTITVTLTVNGKEIKLPLKVGANAKVLLNGVSTTLANLPVGANVQIGGSGSNALTVNATTKTDTTKLLDLVGSIAGVNAKDRTVTVKTPAGTSTLPVTADAKVTLNGANVALAALPVNATVEASGLTTANGSIINKIVAKLVKPVVTPSPSKSVPASPTPAPSKSVTASPSPSKSVAATVKAGVRK